MVDISNEKIASAAVVGLGWIGALHCGILSSLPHCRLTAIVEQNSKLEQIAAKAISSVNFYTDCRDMLAKERPDIVYVCTPVTTHLQLTQEILESPNRPNGLFVEKPLAMNIEEARQMANLAKKNNVLTGVGFQRRFMPTTRKTRDAIESGEIGDMLLARCHLFGEGTVEQGEGWKYSPDSGGATLELGIHLIDTMISLFGEGKVLWAKNQKIVSSTCEDYASAMIRFDRVPIASFEVGWSMWGIKPDDFRIEIYGTRGTIVMTPDEVDIFYKPPNAASASAHKAFHSSQLVEKLPILLGRPEYVLSDMNFVANVSRGRTPLVSFETGVKANQLADAIRGYGRGDAE